MANENSASREATNASTSSFNPDMRGASAGSEGSMGSSSQLGGGIYDVDFDAEERYWSEQKTRDFTAHKPAYRYGADLFSRSEGKSFDELKDSDLSVGWERAKNTASMKWEDAKEAVKEAYDRLFHTDRRDRMNP